MESEQDDDDDDSMLMLAPTHAHAGTHDIEDDRPDDVLRRRPRGGDASASRENTLGLRLSSCDPRTVGSGIRQTLPADMKHGWRGSVEFREPITQTQEPMQHQSCGSAAFVASVLVELASLVRLCLVSMAHRMSTPSNRPLLLPSPRQTSLGNPAGASQLAWNAVHLSLRGRSIQHEGGAASSLEL